MNTIAPSPYKGSIATARMVAEQIAERFGTEAVGDYDPKTNCFTYREWLRRGYQVKKGEHGLRSITFIEKEEKNGEKTKYPKTVVLFYHLQVELKQA